MHTCIYVCMRTYMYVHVCTHMYMYIHVKYTCTSNTCSYVLPYVYIHIYICVHMYAFVNLSSLCSHESTWSLVSVLGAKFSAFCCGLGLWVRVLPAAASAMMITNGKRLNIKVYRANVVLRAQNCILGFIPQ